MANEDKKVVVAYVPFKTFLAAIEGLDRHMPAQIDSSVWPTYSGAIRSQLLGAFKFLNLIDDKGNPTAALKSLVENKTDRKALLRKIIEASYKPVISAGLQHMTPKMFDDLMDAYGMTGDTQKKVSSFFIQAAKYSEIPMSPLLLKRGRSGTSKRRRASEGQDSEGDVFHVEPSTSQGSSRTVELRAGGKLTLILSVNMFDLVGEDREFVFGVIDQCQQYEAKKGKAAKA
jgi:hypothetical protein